jgi:DNA-binding transcriptional LysR family regulator
MDLNRALTFARVVEDGGFTAAARTLRVPKSSVSRSVALLEEELGVRLLQRSTRALAGLEDAEAAVSDLQSSLRGTVRITAPADAGVWILAPIVARFVAAHPDVHVDLLLTGRLVDLVTEGVDFALRAAKLTDSSLVARRLTPRDAGLFAAPSYLARRPAPARVSELATHDCVLFRGVHGRSRWLLTGPEGDESVDVRGPISADDFAFVHQVTVQGAGIALLPEFLGEVYGAHTRGELVRVLPGYVGLRGVWHLVYPSGRYLPRRAVAFRDAVLAELGAAPSL